MIDKISSGRVMPSYGAAIVDRLEKHNEKEGSGVMFLERVCGRLRKSSMIGSPIS